MVTMYKRKRALRDLVCIRVVCACCPGKEESGRDAWRRQRMTPCRNAGEHGTTPRRDIAHGVCNVMDATTVTGRER